MCLYHFITVEMSPVVQVHVTDSGAGEKLLGHLSQRLITYSHPLSSGGCINFSHFNLLYQTCWALPNMMKLDMYNGPVKAFQSCTDEGVMSLLGPIEGGKARLKIFHTCCQSGMFRDSVIISNFIPFNFLKP